jgi:hypothetical protein
MTNVFNVIDDSIIATPDSSLPESTTWDSGSSDNSAGMSGSAATSSAATTEGYPYAASDAGSQSHGIALGAGIGIPAGIALAGLIGALLYWFRRRKARRNNTGLRSMEAGTMSRKWYRGVDYVPRRGSERGRLQEMEAPRTWVQEMDHDSRMNGHVDNNLNSEKAFEGGNLGVHEAPA